MTARVIAIVGPTGSGKSELAVAVAERLGGEIVNCDSRQVYRGLDIGSAKPAAAIRARAPHHLFDVAEPAETFDCARYASLARAAIAAIGERGGTALLVGGTGLYLKAVRYGLFPGPPRDDELRAELAAREDARAGSLYDELVAIDPRAAARLHINDRMRIVRALEVYRLTGVPISRWQAEHAFRGDELAMDVVGLAVPRPRLFERLDARCRAMVEQGLVDEVRGLLAAGCPPAAPALQSIGYREIGDYLRGRGGLDEAVARMAGATRRFAKRQLTWFRADPTVRWIDAETATVEEVVGAA
jgi:tRNA dimethylallyltransferase